MSTDRLRRTPSDVQHAIRVALKAAPRAMALRERIDADLPPDSLQMLEALEARALAAWHVFTARRPVESGTPLTIEASAMRRSLLYAARALANAGRFDGRELEGMGRRPQSHVARDLGRLAALFRERWSDVHDQTTVAADEVARAAALGVELAAQAGPVSEATLSDSIEVLMPQAMTLLLEAYSEVRRATSFLRWHERDVHLVTPSLHRRRSRKKAVSKPPPSAEPGSPSETGTERVSPIGPTPVPAPEPSGTGSTPGAAPDDGPAPTGEGPAPGGLDLVA